MIALNGWILWDEGVAAWLLWENSKSSWVFSYCSCIASADLGFRWLLFCLPRAITFTHDDCDVSSISLSLIQFPNSWLIFPFPALNLSCSRSSNINAFFCCSFASISTSLTCRERFLGLIRISCFFSDGSIQPGAREFWSHSIITGYFYLFQGLQCPCTSFISYFLRL